MHRYRDAIVYHNEIDDRYERKMFGAYVLFPYSNEEEYKNHRFYESIKEVNVGGLPFLPSSTELVTDILDDLIMDSPDSAFERSTLPLGISEKLAKVNWSQRDVLVGSLKDEEQLNVCLEYKFYHIPKKRIKESNLPIHWVAIYQSKNKFKNHGGIRYYGEVSFSEVVPRSSIVEIPKDSEELYYRFWIREWKMLVKPIEPKEIAGYSHFFTNYFLLVHSGTVPELYISSEEEYRLYNELKRSINDVMINEDRSNAGFAYNDKNVILDANKIFICSGKTIIAEFNILDFGKRPRELCKRIRNVLAYEE